MSALASGKYARPTNSCAAAIFQWVKYLAHVSLFYCGDPALVSQPRCSAIARTSRRLATALFAVGEYLAGQSGAETSVRGFVKRFLPLLL